MQMALCWHFKEMSVRAQEKTLPQESDKPMISRAFPRRFFSEIGVVAKESVSLVFYSFPQGMGKYYYYYYYYLAHQPHQTRSWETEDKTKPLPEEKQRTGGISASPPSFSSHV